MARDERPTGGPGAWTWQKIREYLNDRYGGHLPPHELRASEIKWRKIFSSVGWSVKGQ